MDSIENSYLDVADEYEKEQAALRNSTRELLKDGLDKIPNSLDCCYNCENFCNKEIKCDSEDSEYYGKTLEDILGICYYYKNKN